MMDCRACEDRFADASTGDLTGREHDEFVAHVNACRSCGLKWRRYGAVLGELAGLAEGPDVAVRPGFAQGVMAAISQSPPFVERASLLERWLPWSRGLRWSHGLAAAAMAVVCVFAGLHVSRRGGEEAASRAPERPTMAKIASQPAELRHEATEALAAESVPEEPSLLTKGDATDADVTGAPTEAPVDGSTGARSIAPTRSAGDSDAAAMRPSREETTLDTARAVEPVQPPVTTAQPEAVGAAGPPGLAGPAGPAGRTAPEPVAEAADEAEAAGAATGALSAAQAKSRQLLGGTDGMRTGMDLERISRVRAGQLAQENPYSVTPRPQPWGEPGERLYTFNFQNNTLPFALRSVEKQGDLRIVIIGPLEGRVRANLYDVSPEEALRRLAALANLDLRQTGDRTYEVQAAEPTGDE